jgi:hypothetical protein
LRRERSRPWLVLLFLADWRASLRRAARATATAADLFFGICRDLELSIELSANKKKTDRKNNGDDKGLPHNVPWG